MTKKQWFSWHSLSGVWFGLILFFICWTGAFATISYELDWLFDSKVRAQPQAHNVSLGEAYQKVQTQFPNAQIGIAFSSGEPYFAHDFVVRFKGKPWQHVYVDPVNGEVTGATSFLNIQRFFRDFHMHFFGIFDSIISYYLVLIFALPLCFSTVSAVYLYQGWWKKWLQLSWNGDSRAKLASLHKFSGVWSLWFAVIISLTSIWYLYEFVRMDLVDGKTAFTDVGNFAINPIAELEAQNTQPLSIVTLEKIAQNARPDLDIRAMRFSGGYFYVEGQSDDILVRDRANKLYINPYSGEVVYNQTASSQGFYWRLSDTADPLHFGNFAGLWVKLAWFVCGIALSFLSLSGSYMYVKRQSKLRRKESQQGVKTSLLISCCLLSLIGYYAYKTIMSYGVAGQAPNLPSGSLLFLSVWIIVTLAIISFWIKSLLSVCFTDTKLLYQLKTFS